MSVPDKTQRRIPAMPSSRFSPKISLIAITAFSGLLAFGGGKMYGQNEAKVLAALGNKVGETTLVSEKKEPGFPPYFNKDGSVPKEYFGSNNRLVLPEINGATITVIPDNSSLTLTFTDKTGMQKTAVFDNAGETIGTLYWMGKLYVLTNQNKLAVIDIVKRDAKLVDVSRELSKAGVDFSKNSGNLVFAVYCEGNNYYLAIGAGDSGYTSPIEPPVSEPLSQK